MARYKLLPVPGFKNKHTHTVMLDKRGNGRSSRDKGHSHAVVGFKDQGSHGHKHMLKKKRNAKAMLSKKKY